MKSRPSSLLGALVLALLVATGLSAAPQDPALDKALNSFQKKVHAQLKADLTRFEELQNGSPRAVIRWKGETHSFPPIPDFEPSLQEVKTTYALSALPPGWVLKLNEIGGKLFLEGLRDGKTGVPDERWKSLQDELAETELPRADIPELRDILPGYRAKVDYAAMEVPFAALAEARDEARKTLASIPGASRRTVFEVPDDQGVGGVLIAAFERHHAVAREVGEALRTKVAGVVMKALLELQAEVYGRLRTKLGRDPEADDIAKFGPLLSKEWRKLARFKHGRDYYAGFRAITQGSGGGTGDGKASDLLPVQGTGAGTSGGTMEGTGTGTGASESMGEVPGGGTGDGSATAEAGGGGGGGTGSGEG